MKTFLREATCLNYLPFGQHLVVELIPGDESKHIGIFSLPHSQNCVYGESQPEPEDEAGQERNLFISCNKEGSYKEEGKKTHQCIHTSIFETYAPMSILNILFDMTFPTKHSKIKSVSDNKQATASVDETFRHKIRVLGILAGKN